MLSGQFSQRASPVVLFCVDRRGHGAALTAFTLVLHRICVSKGDGQEAKDFTSQSRPERIMLHCANDSLAHSQLALLSEFIFLGEVDLPV